MMAASIASQPQVSLGRNSGRSRLSSTAVFLDSPHAADFSGPETSRGERQETRRRLGRNGQVFQGLGTSSDSDECSGSDSPSTVRRVTFSNGGAPEQPAQLWQQQHLQDQQLQPHQVQEALPAQLDQLQLPLGTRLWRGAAASVVAGQKLQSLERHAAQLKERQSIHTELRAWVEQVLQGPQDPDLLDPSLDDADAGGSVAGPSDRNSHSHAHHQQHQHQHQHQHLQLQDQTGPEQQERHKHQHRRHRRSQHQLQAGEEPGQGGDAAQISAEQQQLHGRRRSSRHSRHHHRHSHAAAAGGGDVSEAEVLPGGPADVQDTAEAAAAAATQKDGAAEGIQPVEGQQCQAAPALTTPPIHQDPQQWQQFNPAEQQLIAQLQADQQQLLEQLQQAYHQIAALTAAQQQQQQQLTPPAAGAGSGGEQQDLEATLCPSTDTQILILRDSTQAEADDGAQEDPNTAVQGSDSEQQQQQQQSPSFARGSARTSADSSKTAKPSSSTASTPRQRRQSTGAAAAQSPSTPRPPRASALAQHGTAADTSAPQSPRKSLRSSAAAAAAGAAGKGRPKLTMPQGRGLTLPQQQALVTRLQQAEEVMDLLQQDLQESLQAQELLQQQMQDMTLQAQAAAVADPEQLQQQQLEQDQDPEQQQQAALDEANTGFQCEGTSANPSNPELLALQQQLQESLDHSSTLAQQLDAATQVAAAQQDLIEELQQQFAHYQTHHQQGMVEIQELQQQLSDAAQQLQTLQSEHHHSRQQQQQQQQQQEGGNTSTSCTLQNTHPWGVEALLQSGCLDAAAAAGGPVCCQHEARCQQLQSILQAALLQLQAYEAQQCSSSSSMRPQTAAVQGSPRAKSTWQHRPVALHAWLYPVPAALQQQNQAQAQPVSPYIPQQQQQQQQQYQAGKLECYRSISAPRCATAGSARPWGYEDTRVAAGWVNSHSRCNTRGPLTARCASGAVDGCMLPLDSKLRPLTYRGPDRGASDALMPAIAAGGRKPLSRDAQTGLLASLRVAPLSARVRGGAGVQLQSEGPGSGPLGGGWYGCSEHAARSKGDAAQQPVSAAQQPISAAAGGGAGAMGVAGGLAAGHSTSPRSVRGPAGHGLAGRGRDAVPRLALNGLQ